MPETLRDREIVLAGGSGGLGLAAADLLAAEGARLIVSYRHQASRPGQMQADLNSAADRRRLLDAASNLYGLAVFTGDPARVGDPAQLEPVMARSWEVNFAGPILLAREAAARLQAAAAPGAIVLLATMQAVGVFPGSTAYAGAKAALIQAARILAKECRSSNIRVNVVAPGVTTAGMAEASVRSGKYDRYLEEGAIPRFGKAEDIAGAVRFLLMPDNYITGQVLTVDGGLTL